MTIKHSIINFLVVLLILTLFVIQVVFLLPSPYGDSVWFLKLTFNICRDNLFSASPIGTESRTTINHNWIQHGWVYQYLLAKFNLFCSLRGIFLFNYILIIITSLIGYKILQPKEKNYLFKILILLLISLFQISLQFRPEIFTIFLSVLLIYSFEKNHKFLVGFIFAILFFSQPLIMCFLGLFSLIFYLEKIIKNFFLILISFFLLFIILNYIYPYTLVDYINGIWGNRGTWQAGTKIERLNDLYTYYIYPAKFTPFWGLLFFFIILSHIYKNYYFLAVLPFIYFFGIRMPMSNYVLLGITPFLLLCRHNFVFKLQKNFLILLLTLTVILGFAQYLSRNLLTIYFFHNELKNTKIFIDQNINKINYIPAFGFMINKELKLRNEEIKSYLHKPTIDVWSVNGIKNPCPDNILNYKDNAINLFGKKIFNSNAGYGIWVCKIND